MRHIRQVPQITAAVSLTTRSPSLTPRTARPALATVPQNSWPSTTGTFTGHECVAWNWCTSEPHTDTAPTCSSTSCSPISGIGNLAELDGERLERVLDDGCLRGGHGLGLEVGISARRAPAIGVLRISLQISARMLPRSEPAGLKSSASMTSGAPSTTSAAPCAGQAMACCDGQPADRLHRHVDGGDHGVELVHRAQALDQAALVVADVVDDHVDAERRQPAGVGDAIVGQHVVAHHLDAEVAAGVDDAADRRLVGAAHDDHEAGAGLGHHLGLEVAAVHDLQVGDDRVGREALVQRLDGRARRRARISGVPASSQSTPASTAICAVSQRLVEVGEIERDLDDRRGRAACRSMRRGRISGLPDPRHAAAASRRRREPRPAPLTSPAIVDSLGVALSTV